MDINNKLSPFNNNNNGGYYTYVLNSKAVKCYMIHKMSLLIAIYQVQQRVTHYFVKLV